MALAKNSFLEAAVQILDFKLAQDHTPAVRWFQAQNVLGGHQAAWEKIRDNRHVLLHRECFSRRLFPKGQKRKAY